MIEDKTGPVQGLKRKILDIDMSSKSKGRLMATPITCINLNKMLFEPPAEKTIIILDVRPFSDFVVGHISTAYNVTLSSIMLRRLHQGKIHLLDLIKEEQREEVKAKLDNNPLVIVYDVETKFAENVSIQPKNALHVIVNWLQQAEYNTVYLQGGFREMKSDFDVVETPSAMGPQGLNLKLASHKTTSPSVTTPIERHKCEKEPTLILDNLYVGAEDHANDAAVMERLGITHILNVTTRAPQNCHENIKYMFIEIQDSWNQDLVSHFEPAFDFIEEARRAGGCVLIHCMAGISRSPTVAIGYLMKTQQLSLSKAYHLVKTKRPSVAPNLDFMGELEIYEKKLKQENPAYETSGWEEERRSATLLKRGLKLPSAKGGLTITIPK
eukprot:m.22186 g.22186  ORF g.22186 m.22186 type:complete len:383 (-) comp5430_c0_seq1:51-1199(-)